MNRMPFFNTDPRGTDSHVVTATQQKLHNLRLNSVKIAFLAAIIALCAALSGCAPGRAGIRHNYSTEYGNGTVYYETGRPVPPPPPGTRYQSKPPKPKKKKAPKPPKHKKHDKHNKNHGKPGKPGSHDSHRR